ncbi:MULTISPECIES: hypothetical protein [Nostoc]|uniref:Uncharacterized protein n=1 Tax=Nostoc paludosum FACHB-159 TaxID=2692908 RepID=A0ABR8KJG0_9NOSO|nr:MULTISPECIES: hypothetical protein [Nostoc]MBD2681924.1 hypothetical protein [Nostoc sp. FACHB-857]MBD2738247.1 hypothetical protein [Nostoc paludosum FACHB-159]
MQSSSVSQTISLINRDSSFSDNQMAYRLALMMEKYPHTPSKSIQSTPALDITERENIINEMKATLSLTQNAQSTEDYRRSLKNKYLKEYTQKLRLHQADTPEHNSSRVENLINEKKKTFLQQMLDEEGRKLPLVDSQQPTPKETENNQVVKKSLIPALMNIIVTKGQDTIGGRVYEGMTYRLNLLMREGMQRLTVWRKSDNLSAFSAYKDSDKEYKVIHNNLSPQETQKLIDFDQKQRQQQQLPQPEQNINSYDGPEFD